MKHKSSILQSPLLIPVIGCILLAGVGLLYFAGYFKALTVLAGIGIVVLLLRRDLHPLCSVPALLLLSFVAFSALTAFWTMSGKFFLREYSKLFVAGGIFLFVVLSRRFDEAHLRRLLSLIAGVCSIYAVLSVEAASTGLTQTLLHQLPDMASLGLGFEADTRLTGIFGNANISASIFALGIFLSLALLCGEEKASRRTPWAVMLSLNAFVFLLSFSMGGIACFALATLFYLAFSGQARGSVLVRMLEVVIPTLLFAFFAFPFFNRTGVAVLVPLCAMALNAVAVSLLEHKTAPRLIAVLVGHQKLVLGLVFGVILAAALYIVLGYNLTGPHSFNGSELRRSSYPQSGIQTLTVEASDDVMVTITSQTMPQVMMHTDTVLYQGPAAVAEFTVPEGSQVCYFTFSAPEGTILSQALIGGETPIPLNYTLIPGFIANRIQGLWANQNAIQRTVFFEDGMKLFAQRPLTGNGVGAFETGVSSVQSFRYETRYTHNHYIQILLEDGIVGFTLFALALVAMAVTLWRQRKRQDWPFGWVYPALWAALAMVVAHAAVEVSMSMVIYLCMVYAVFGVIVRVCEVETAVAPARAKSGKSQQKSKLKELTVRCLCALLPAVFSVSVLFNMFANNLRARPVAEPFLFLQNLTDSITMDPYEANDAKASFLVNVVDEQADGLRAQADVYAQELLEVQSNTLAHALVYYYMGTGQFTQAVNAAKAGAFYSAADPDMWNGTIDLLQTGFMNLFDSPLLGEEGPALTHALLDYYQQLQLHNEVSMEPIALSVSSQDFFSKLLRIAAYDQRLDEAVITMGYQLFDLAHSCDADTNGIPDQITSHSGATFADGAIALEEEGALQLALPLPSEGQLQVKVTCDNPQGLLLFPPRTEQSIIPEIVDGQAVFTMELDLTAALNQILTLTSSAPQAISQLEVKTLDIKGM